MGGIWRKIDFEKNIPRSLGSEAYDVKRDFPSEVENLQNYIKSSRSSEKPLRVLFSGHRLRWVWLKDGDTMRRPEHEVKMKNWKTPKKTYSWENGASVVVNARTLEIWMRSRPYKNPVRMIYANWSKADLLARKFSTWAGIGLMALASEHPADCQAAHLVLESKLLNPFLRPQAGLETSRRIGLVFDHSHKDKPEFTGQESIEGVFGADYMFREFPQEWRMHAKTDAEKWGELEAALGQVHSESAKLAEGQAAILKILLKK